VLYVQLLVPSPLPETPVLLTDIIWPPLPPLFTLPVKPELLLAPPPLVSHHLAQLDITSD
jgi:hypothetical protein